MFPFQHNHIPVCCIFFSPMRVCCMTNSFLPSIWLPDCWRLSDNLYVFFDWPLVSEIKVLWFGRNRCVWTVVTLQESELWSFSYCVYSVLRNQILKGVLPSKVKARCSALVSEQSVVASKFFLNNFQSTCPWCIYNIYSSIKLASMFFCCENTSAHGHWINSCWLLSAEAKI